MNRPLLHFLTIYFNTFVPPTFTLVDRPLWHLLAVHFGAFWPSILTFLDHPLRHFDVSRGTEHFQSNDRLLWLKRAFTIVLDCPLLLKWLSSLTQGRPLSRDRPLWTWLHLSKIIKGSGSQCGLLQSVRNRFPRLFCKVWCQWYSLLEPMPEREHRMHKEWVFQYVDAYNLQAIDYNITWI